MWVGVDLQEEGRLELRPVLRNGSDFERKWRVRSGSGRGGGGATLIHVSWGQIIYHPVQTNTLPDSLSEGRGWCGGVACEVRQGCERRCCLTPITLPLISPLRPLCSLLLTQRPSPPPPPPLTPPPPFPPLPEAAATRSLHFLSPVLFLLRCLSSLDQTQVDQESRSICVLEEELYRSLCVDICIITPAN